VAGHDKDATKVAALRQETEDRDIRGAADIKEFIALLRKPRALMMRVPAGAPVDSVIKDLLRHLDKGDLIIDAGKVVQQLKAAMQVTMLCSGEAMPDCSRRCRPARAWETMQTHSKADAIFGENVTADRLMGDLSISRLLRKPTCGKRPRRGRGG
jgi:hypothetical protein